MLMYNYPMYMISSLACNNLFYFLKVTAHVKKKNAFKKVKDMVAGSKISSGLNIYIYDTLKQMVKTAPKDGF